MLLNLQIPNHQLNTIERFINYVESLMIDLDELPTEEYLFGWMYRNFCNWAPVIARFRLAYRNPAGYPNRCFAFLGYKVNEELQWDQIEANKKHQDGYLSSFSKHLQGHHASIWGNNDILQKVAPVKGPDNKKTTQKQPATGGVGQKPPAPAPSKADPQTIANLKNTFSQLEKNLKDYKAKANQNVQAAAGGKPDPKAAQPKANANAVAGDFSKFTKLKKPLAEMSAAECKKVLCRFFVTGTCSKG